MTDPAEQITMTNAEIPLQVITQDDVRASIRRAKKNLEKAAEEIVWQIEMEAWRTLGYSSWDAMREAEYGSAAFMVPRRQRPELVARMRRSGLTHKQIADTAGVSDETVRRDLQTTNVDSEAIANTRGQQRPPSYVRNGKPTAAGMEALAKDVPAVKAKPRKRPLPKVYFETGYDLSKKVERLARLHQDDRFVGHREEMAQRHGPELARAANLLCDLLDDLGVDRFRFGYGGGDDEA